MRYIGLHGPSGVGKDTLVADCVKYSNGLTIKHLKFAAPLRAIVYTLYDLDWSKAGDKDYEQGEGVTEKLIAFNDVYRPVHPDLMLTGLDCCIRHVIEESPPNLDDTFVLISDVRQVNEYEHITNNLGGSVIRLHRSSQSRPTQSLDNLLDDVNLCVLPLFQYERQIAVRRTLNLALPHGDIPGYGTETMFADKMYDVFRVMGIRTTHWSILNIIERMYEYTDKINDYQ